MLTLQRARVEKALEDRLSHNAGANDAKRSSAFQERRLAGFPCDSCGHGNRQSYPASARCASARRPFRSKRKLVKATTKLSAALRSCLWQRSLTKRVKRRLQQCYSHGHGRDLAEKTQTCTRLRLDRVLDERISSDISRRPQKKSLFDEAPVGGLQRTA